MRAGLELSLSAGTRDPGSLACRTVTAPSDALPLLRLVWADRDLLPGAPAYPARIGQPRDAVLIDSYLSSSVARRALRLAATEGREPILVGQPLLVARVILDACTAPLPPHLTIITGGYATPQSLRAAMRSWCRSAGCEARFLEMYGLVEADAACLLAVCAESAPATYVPRPGVQARVVRGFLELMIEGHPQWDQQWCQTGDHAIALPGGGLAIPGTPRASLETLAALDGWSVQRWERRTGYRAGRAEGARWIVRPGVADLEPDEITLGSMALDPTGLWHGKPDWS
jgi:hypothetical protein